MVAHEEICGEGESASAKGLSHARLLYAWSPGSSESLFLSVEDSFCMKLF